MTPANEPMRCPRCGSHDPQQHLWTCYVCGERVPCVQAGSDEEWDRLGELHAAGCRYVQERGIVLVW